MQGKPTPQVNCSKEGTPVIAFLHSTIHRIHSLTVDAHAALQAHPEGFCQRSCRHHADAPSLLQFKRRRNSSSDRVASHSGTLSPSSVPTSWHALLPVRSGSSTTASHSTAAALLGPATPDLAGQPGAQHAAPPLVSAGGPASAPGLPQQACSSADCC